MSEGIPKNTQEWSNLHRGE